MLMHSLRFFASAAAAIALVACSSGDGRVSLFLTDAPGDGVRSAVVTIDEVYLQGEGDEPSRIVLLDEPITTDLIELANTAELLVDDHVVPSGIYGQLRFVIGGAAIALQSDGVTEVWATPGYTELPEGQVAGELTIPSWSTSGFKVKLPGGSLWVEGDQRVLLVDFDVAESVGQEIGNGDLVMRPVIDAIDLELSGSVAVELALGETDPAMVEGTAAVLHDAAGNLEGRLPLEVDGDAGIASATFLYLRADEGPFSLTLEPAPEVSLRTAPALPLLIDVTSGRVVAVELAITGVVLD